MALLTIWAIIDHSFEWMKWLYPLFRTHRYIIIIFTYQYRSIYPRISINSMIIQSRNQTLTWFDLTSRKQFNSNILTIQSISMNSSFPNIPIHTKWTMFEELTSKLISNSSMIQDSMIQWFNDSMIQLYFT